MDSNEEANQYGDERRETSEASKEHDKAQGSTSGGDHIIGSAALRPVFLGNLRPEYSSDKIHELFTRPIPPPGATEETFQAIPVDRIDVKRGFCFVFLKDATSQQDKDNVESFVSAINGMELDQVSNGLRAEFARGDGRVKRKEDDRRRNIQPSETLFVVNFHEETTKREDLQMLFEPYGELVRIDMKRNYAFVQFRTIDEATRALNATNGGRLDQSVLSVEYVARQRGERDRRGRRDDFHPRGDRRGYDRRGGPPDRFRGGPPPPRMGGRGYVPGPGDRIDRDRYHEDPRGAPPRDDYRPRVRDRSPPPGYRGTSPAMGYRPRDVGGYRGDRGVSPGGGYGRRPSRSRSRSPGGYRSRSPPRRYDDRDGRMGRYDDYRDRRGLPPGGPPPAAGWSPEGYRDRGRSPEGDVYRGGRDDRGYRA